MRIAGVLLVVLITAASPSLAGAGGTALDDFEGATTEGWAVGMNPQPALVTTGGPFGAGDGFLQMTSDGGGTHGKLVVFNTTATWTGNYTSIGRTTIYMHARNLGATNLTIRLEIESGAGNAVTTAGHTLPAGGGWRLLVFDVRASALTGGNPASTLVAVTKLRIMHNTFATGSPPSIVAQLGLDNISDFPPPTFCGDGVDNGTELCDGTDLAGQSCTTYGYANPAGLQCNASCDAHITSGCAAVCGNSVPEPGEACDTGGNSASCDGNCTAVSCGDGTCNGAAGETAATCIGDCPTTCGDALITGTEMCDGSNLAGNDCADFGYVATAGLACASSCAAFVTTGCTAVCGNSTPEPGEACDAGSQTAGCDGDCTAVTCGDARCNSAAGETAGTCVADCGTVCGDGLVTGAEACDGANLDGDDCADHGYVAPAGLACAGNCASFVTTGCTAACGNSTPEPGEACDSGGVDSATCDADCTARVCGDSRCNVVAGETPVSCGADCPTVCGDALVSGAEVCDGSNLAGQDCADHGYLATAGLACAGGCNGFVTGGCIAACGNGSAEPGEPCDSGGVDSATCDADCSTPTCGDARCNVAAGETAQSCSLDCEGDEPDAGVPLDAGLPPDAGVPDGGPAPDAGEPPGGGGEGCCSGSSSPAGGFLLALLTLLGLVVRTRSMNRR